MAKKKFYAVNIGRVPGIYDAWDDPNSAKSAKAQVDKFPGAKYKGYGTYEEAYQAVYGAVPKKNDPVVQDKHLLKREVTELSISTDAACSGNPGPLEYRIVWTDTGELIYHSPVFYGTSNIGEFLALVYAIQYAREHRLNCDIYTDSVTAISWVRKKSLKSSFDFAQDDVLKAEVDAALEYLHDNKSYDRVLKWNTRLQGEIKADFGRK